MLSRRILPVALLAALVLTPSGVQAGPKGDLAELSHARSVQDLHLKALPDRVADGTLALGDGVEAPRLALPAAMVNPSTAGNDLNDGETYFAIGDSITSSRFVDLGAAHVAAAKAGPALPKLDQVTADQDGDGLPDVAETAADTNLPQGEGSYLNLMRDLHDPLASADHSLAGSGKGSAWGKAAAADYLLGAHANQTVVVLLGNNDALHGVSPSATAANLKAIHAQVRATGARSVWCNLVVPAAGSAWDEGFAARVAAIEAAAAASGAVAVPFYDALDVHPYNGQLDAQDPAYFHDAIHPNNLGHLRMAEMLWQYL